MTATGADKTRKACTFILAEIMALGTFSALSVLTINIVARTSACKSLSDANYSALIVYSEILPAFISAFLAGLMMRSRPVLLAIVLIGIKTCVRVSCVPCIAIFPHFWFESFASLGTAAAGAGLACLLMRRLGMSEPARLHWSALVALVVPALLWLFTLRFGMLS